MKIDPDKIQKKLDELNAGTGTVKPWIAVDGYNAITQANIDTSPPTFLPASGILVKVFVNRQTGELKNFPLVLFELPEQK